MVERFAAEGERLLTDYRFDPRTGLWRHASGPPRPPLTLADITYGPDGGIGLPPAPQSGRRGSVPGYLRQSRAILAARPVRLDDGPTGLPPEFEVLRWFPLPPACLQGRSACAADLG